jgi:hypothetical protein
MKIKIANYKRMTESILSANKTINSDSCKEKYSFSIKLNDFQAYTYTEIPGNMTFKVLFWKIPDF